MSTIRNVEQNILIGEYTLGLLNLQEAAQAQDLMGKNHHAVVTALKWEDGFLALVDQLPPINPPEQLLERIQAALGQEVTRATPPSIWPRTFARIIKATWGNIAFLRVSSLILALATLAYATTTTPRMTIVDVPPTQIAVLQAPGLTSTPGWVLTIDAQHNMVLKPRVHIDVPAEASVQLWTRNSDTTPPRSLGVIDPNQPVVIPAATIGAISPDQLFEMTLEAQGGSAKGSPSGPILFLGRTIVISP